MNDFWKQFLNTFSGRTFSIEDRLAARMIQMGAVASLCGMIVCIWAHTHVAAVLITGFMSVSISCAYIVCSKLKNMIILRRIVLIGVLVLMPPLWLFGGGINSGMTIWIAFEILFLSISLYGGIQKIAVTLAVLLSFVTFLVEKYTSLNYGLATEQDIAVSMFGSVCVVGTLIFYITNYEKQLYMKEFKLVEEKNEKLVEYAAEADKANRSQKLFLANMSHEVRSPMNVVLGFNGLILESKNIDEIHEFAHNIDTAGKSLLVVINDILDYSKIEAGKMEIFPTPYRLEELVNLSRASGELPCKNKNIEFKCSVDETIPVNLYGDSIRIRQCITNIITNAVKYTEKGFVFLDFKNGGISEDGDRVKLIISVTDSGRGISDKQKEALFSRFTRLDESTNRAIEGTGLGLALTKSFLDLMGGEITVESEVGKGSIFSIFIEQKISSEEEVNKLDSRVGDTNVDKNIEGMKVLVVDDSATNLALMKRIMLKFKIDATLASSGLETLERVKNEKFDVILLDHMMPEMDGVETFNRMKEMEHLNKETPVIMLTANAMSGAYEEYMEIGFDGYLSKPCHPEHIKRELMRFV